MSRKYISLNNHTTFSIGNGLSKPIDLFNKAKELGQDAIGIADYDTMAGMWDCLKAYKKTGVKLIPGCVFNFTDSVKVTDAKFTNLILLAKNHTGYKNILALRKFGFDNYIIHFKKAFSRIDWSLLEKHSDGIICLSADGNGYIPQLIMEDRYEEAVNAANRFKDIFGDNFVLELQPHNLQRRANAYTGDVDQRKINLALKKISEECNIRCVVTTNSHYINKEDHDAHDLLLSISSGQPVSSGQRLTFDKRDFYVKTADEIYSYFARHKNMWGEAFIDSLFDNTVELANRCENPDWIDPAVATGIKSQLPRFPIEDEPDYEDFLKWKETYSENHLPDDALYYRYKSFKGLDEKIASGELSENDRDLFVKDMLEEFDVFEARGFSSYMLIVSDMINWCRKNDISVGPGRGSIGGSKSAYVIGLHAANPNKYGLIFARFLNKFKDAFPDIDTDFSPAGRDKLHAYIKQKYGEDHVAHVSNINTITAKVYARDLARAFDLAGDRKESVALGNDIADSITDDAKYVKKALESSPLFAEYAKQYPELERFADSIGGQARAWSTHAAGIVLGVEPLHTIVPIRRDPHGAICLEYEKERAEENGLIKIDTLGLKTLDIIDNTIRIIKNVGKTPPPEPFDYEVEDKETYDLISRGDTFGVFQLTGVAAPVCRILKPKSIYDIALISSLIRPAAKEIIPEFMKVRNGEKELELIHPSLDRALRPTNGFGLFEESLMFIAADVAGWNFHEADGLRKMTKDKGKHPEKVEALRASFIADAEKNNNINKEIATRIWDEVIAGFGGYGFNSSHAVLYSMISFKTAYLKAHYPLEFLVANLMSEVESNSPMAKDNILKIKDEIRALGVKVLPPDINKSHMSYQIIDDKTLMTGLDALKYMGGDAIPDIMSKRPFSSFKDFMVRIDPSKVRSTTIQALAASGSLDCFGLDRKVMFLYCADFKKKIQALRTSLDKKVQKGKITQEEADAEIAAFEYPFPEEKPWPVHEIYALEEYYLGEGLSGTVPERFPGFFNSKVIDIKKISEMMPFVRHSDDERDNRKANTHNIEHHGIPGIKGVVMNVHEFKVKKEDSPIFGQIMARFTVQDPYGNNLDCVAFPDGWDRAKSRIEKELSGGKSKFDVGIALFFNGAFQWENENTYSFILGDILSYKDSPSLPKDKKAKSVKIPRKTKVTKKEVKEMSSQDLAEALDEEMAFEDIK